MARSSFSAGLTLRRVVFKPDEMVADGFFRGAPLAAVGLLLRLLPYVVLGPVDRSRMFRLAGVSTYLFEKHWPDLQPFFRETAPGFCEFIGSDAIAIQTLAESRPSLRSFLNRLVAYWGQACVYCGGGVISDLEIEHIVPRSRGGSDDITNLTLACIACNRLKGTRTAREFGYPHIHERAVRIQ